MEKHGGDDGSDRPDSAAVHQESRPLRPLKPLFVLPAPVSTSSTASTAILCSPSGSESDSDERQAFLSKQSVATKKKKKKSHSSRQYTNSKSRGLSGSAPTSASSSSSTSPVLTDPRKHRSKRHHKQLYQEDLERGDRSGRDESVAAASHEWQVLREYSQCARAHGVVQVVHLKRANFGLRWQNSDDDDEPAHLTPTCMVGPHWWLMASTFTVFTGVALVITVLTAPHSGAGEAITGILLSTACLSMYAMVGCANPGIVQRIDVAPDDTYSYCDHCDSYRPQGALHCMDCRVCIEGYDHHCPWTGKCIGRGNVRFFYAWLFFLVLAFVYEVIEFTTYILPPEDQPSPSYYDDLTFAPVASSP